jgi:hypothetical protein
VPTSPTLVLVQPSSPLVQPQISPTASAVALATPLIKSIRASQAFHPSLYSPLHLVFYLFVQRILIKTSSLFALLHHVPLILFQKRFLATVNMSEAPKPTVEEPVVAPVTETPVVEAVAEVKATEEPAVEAAATEEAAPVKEEVKPVEDGVLGYKAPGLLK